jgi:hypothetical protein
MKKPIKSKKKEKIAESNIQSNQMIKDETKKPEFKNEKKKKKK